MSTISGVWWCVPVIPATQGSINNRITVQAAPDIERDPISRWGVCLMSAEFRPQYSPLPPQKKTLLFL
jgi:hypothetical protein